MRTPARSSLVPGGGRLFPVGRLDYDSEGLILLTDDGDLAMRLTHPRHGVEKEYRALLRGDVTDEVLAQLGVGVEIDARQTAPATFERLESHSDGIWVRVVLHEGRNRQIRRMCQALGYRVTKLHRVRIMHITVQGLGVGEWRELAAQERDQLLNAVGRVRECRCPEPG